MKCLDFDWQTNEFMLYCRVTQLREKSMMAYEQSLKLFERWCRDEMSRTFVQENPVHAKKVIQAVRKAHSFMRENPEEATKYLLERGWNGGDYDMNVMLNRSMQFGTSDEFTKNSLEQIVNDYLRLGLIQGMDNAEEIMDLAWSPVLD